MYEMSVNVGAGGTSSAIAISTTSAQSAVFVANAGTSPGGTTVIVTPSVNCFVRQGVDPTATNDGTDLLLLGGQSYRINVADTHKLAFRTASGSGTVYLTPRG